jgi:hypothetical protein
MFLAAFEETDKEEAPNYKTHNTAAIKAALQMQMIKR